MSWQQEDHQLLLAAADELPDYLHSPVIQWKTKYPMVLTVGRLLLAQKRYLLITGETARQVDILERIDRVRHQNKAAWQRKIEQEIPYRKTLWQTMLKDYLEEGLDASYPSQITNRVILSLLVAEADFVSPTIERSLSEMDDSLRRMILSGSFLWDKELEPGFDHLNFWFLYTNRKER